MRHVVPYWCALYGTLLVQALWGGPVRKSLGLKLCFGVLCGLGLAGLLNYARLFVGLGEETGVLLAGEALLLAVCAGAYAFSRRGRGESPAEPETPRARLPFPFLAALSGLALIALCSSLYTSVCKGLSFPFGLWDAWASWNYKARCLSLNAPNWRLYVGDNQVVPGADYPLLLPCLVARGYAYAGGVSHLTGALLGPLFSYASLALLFLGCWQLRSITQGLLAGLVWLGTPGPFQWGSSQYGDTPVGAYFLAALVVLGIHDRRVRRARGMLVLAGLLAGFGAFVKHEGQMFLLILAGVRFVSVALGRGLGTATSETGAFVGGCLPGVAAVLSLRAVSDSTGYLEQNAGLGAMVEKLLDPARHAQVVSALWDGFTQAPSRVYAALLVAAGVLGLLLGTRRDTRATRSERLAPSIAVLLALGGHAAIFLMTPMDLHTHLVTTAHRFLAQVYPALFFAYFTLIAAAEDGRGAAPVPRGSADPGGTRG